MGFSTFFVTRGSSSNNKFGSTSKIERFQDGDSPILENDFLKVQFSSNTGKLSSITNKASGVSIYVEEDIQVKKKNLFYFILI